jgi:hypothetical protein
MSMKSLQRAAAIGVLAGMLVVSSAEAAPVALRAAAPDLWVQAWECVASWWNGLTGTLTGEKSGTSDPNGTSTPLSPRGATSTTPPPGVTGTGDLGPGTDPNG